MKIAFGMPFKNDLNRLREHLVKLPHIFDEYIFIDTGSIDESASFIKELFPTAIIITEKSSTIDIGKWRNMIIDKAEKQKCDWMFMLDTDETMFEKDIKAVFEYMKKGNSDVYRLARFEFGLDKEHYQTDIFPDWQGRVFKLNCGYYFYPAIHTTLHKDNKAIEGQYLPQCVIYHYGWIEGVAKRMLHYYNIERSLKGLPLADRLPALIHTKDPEWVKTAQLYFGKQP